MEDKQCPYLIDNSTSMIKKAKCNIDDDICAYIRYCTTRKRIVSSPLYTLQGCNKQKSFERSKENGN